MYCVICNYVLIMFNLCAGFHRCRHVFLNSLLNGLVRVGVNCELSANHASVYRHVAVVHGHVWRTLCSVCATGARVAHPVPCNS